METGLDYMKARYYSGTMGRFTSVDPSRKSIIPTNPQTWNRYSYTYNNPLRYVDKNGKWPTETHNTIIRNAFDRLAKQQPDKVRQIQKGSESVDANWRKPVRLVLENTLVESMAPRHAMTPGFKVRELGSESAAREWARGEATKFINEKMGEATAMQNANHNQSTVSNAALNLFGQGAHPIMDGASPAHREFQVYDLAPYQTLAAVNTLVAAALYARDMDAHTETESKHPTQDEMNQMVDDLRMQYLNAFGREMYEQAVSPEERAATDRRRNPQR
jgi:RHS repeat-associated protein